MSAPSALLEKLVFNFDAEEWNEHDLARLKLSELSILSQLFGGPKHLPKEEMIVRLLCTRQVRKEIAPYGTNRDEAQRLADSAPKERLKWMAGQMKLWRSGSKIQLAITLIQWRDRARVEGKKFLALLTQLPPGRAVQMKLPL